MFGVPIADTTMAETLELIAEFVDDGRRTGRTHQISTVNVDFLVNALDDTVVASILQHADLCLPDGMPVVWGSQLLDMPLRERVAGADLVPLLVEQSGRRGWHIHFFGSTEDVAAAATSVLREQYPTARFSIDPGPRIGDVHEVAESVLDQIAAVDADILCVALGNPKQERFIHAHRERLGVPVMIGVGGSLDMLVGKRRRAPKWMQTGGLEWIFRALQEPRRLGRRYARDARIFTPAIVREWRANRSRREGAGIRLSPVSEVDHVVVALEGNDLLTATEWNDAIVRVLEGSHLRIDAPTCQRPFDSAIAQLVGLAAATRRGGGSISWTPRHIYPPAWIDEMQLAPTVIGLHHA